MPLNVAYVVSDIGCDAECTTNGAFIAAARNALEALQLGWVPIRYKGQWLVIYPGAMPKEPPPFWAGDPFTALADAYNWYRAHVERPE